MEMSSCLALGRAFPGAGVRPLTSDELDQTRGGGADPGTLIALVFVGGVVVGLLDRLLFGGCSCR